MRSAGQTPSSSTKVGWTDTNAYWEAWKAGQTQCLLENSLNIFALRKESLLYGFVCCKFCRYREL